MSEREQLEIPEKCFRSKGEEERVNHKVHTLLDGIVVDLSHPTDDTEDGKISRRGLLKGFAALGAMVVGYGIYRSKEESSQMDYLNRLQEDLSLGLPPKYIYTPTMPLQLSMNDLIGEDLQVVQLPASPETPILINHKSIDLAYPFEAINLQVVTLPHNHSLALKFIVETGDTSSGDTLKKAAYYPYSPLNEENTPGKLTRKNPNLVPVSVKDGKLYSGIEEFKGKIDIIKQDPSQMTPYPIG